MVLEDFHGNAKGPDWPSHLERETKVGGFAPWQFGTCHGSAEAVVVLVWGETPRSVEERPTGNTKS